MPPRKRYKEYLRDVSVHVPIRTKYHYKRSAQQSQASESSHTLPSDVPADDQSHVDLSDVRDQQHRNDSSPVPPGGSEQVDVLHQECVLDDGDGSDVSACGETSSSDESDSDSDFPDEYLYPGCKITRGESLLLLMAHSLRHHSSREATESLLKVVQAHFPDGTQFPSSKYLFFKQFAQEKGQPDMFFYCKKAKCLLGKSEASETDIHCPGCDGEHSVKELEKDGSYFLVFNIEEQVRRILEDADTHIVLTQRERSMDMSDIKHSKGYSELGLGQDDISVSWNTDGVPLYESSKCSIWPIQLQIIELPLKQRVKRIVLAGLWFGGEKPEMGVFLKPFVDEMNKLSSNGSCGQPQMAQESTPVCFQDHVSWTPLRDVGSWA
ncbi:hypothetical protein HPB48_009918 [Haemaphysalis longicornis]|uniref:Uncharacterized protein n=1 Tax=Haemaphysalis longicornis TaxID=44386 RepID=A0A9J6GU03_HAELO|nr:hypothetical protein HPB48_009918 [Haemaphysalis longicornis]